MLGIFTEYLNYRKYSFQRLYYINIPSYRSKDIKEFKFTSSINWFFILYTKIGCLVLNLYTVDIIIISNSD